MFLFFLACFASKDKAEKKDTPQLILDDKTIDVFWDDGDTFGFFDEKGKKIKARLNGYNTLESYGPVHKWGDWTPQELYRFAKDSGDIARATVWKCKTLPKGGGYGRLLVDCPELRSELIRTGYAHPFSVNKEAPRKDLEDLAFARNNKNGMWEKGTPNFLITSLHSQDEKPDKDAYNRVCDMNTGMCNAQDHTDVYSSCQEVCLQDSCMVYVPYKKRYGDSKAECILIK